MIRRSIAAVVALVLVAFGGAASADPAVAVGTADTRVSLGGIEIAGVGSADLGWARSFSTTDPDDRVNPFGGGMPYALAGIKVGEQEVSANSKEATEHTGQTFPLAGLGQLTVGRIAAGAGDSSAHSVVDAIGAQIGVEPLGITLSMDSLGADVDDSAALSGNRVVVRDLSVALGDIIPAEIMAMLSLEQLMNILDQLPVELPLGALDDALDQVRDVVSSVGAVDKAEAATEDARRARDDALAQRPSLAAGASEARAARDEVVAELADVESDLATTESEIDSKLEEWSSNNCDAPLLGDLPPCPSIEESLDALAAERASLQDSLPGHQDAAAKSEQALDEADAALAELDETVSALEAEIAALIDELDRLIDQLLELARDIEGLDVAGLLAAVLDGLDGMELIAADEISAGVRTEATAQTSSAVATCELDGLRVLGEAVPVTACRDAEGAFAQVDEVLSRILSVLPVRADVPSDLVEVSGPEIATTEPGHRNGDAQTAVAQIKGVRIVVKPVSLEQFTDGVVETLRDLTSGALEEISELTGSDIDLSEAETILDDLLAIVEDLPVGDLVSGVSLSGVSIALADVTSHSTFGEADVSPAPAGDSAPPVSPPAGDLPHTGGGPGLALVLLAFGGAATWVTLVAPARRAATHKPL